jgi:chorismate dehydratase
MLRNGSQGNPSQRPDEKSSVRIKTGMRRLRISAISYLNTAPLMWDFEHGEPGRNFDISYTLPSACARALEGGTADIGIIPAAAYSQIPGLQVLPGVAIASRRAVRSILLVSKVPVEKIRTIALDTSSMTSVALTKILFEKWLGGGRTFSPMEPNIDRMLATNDAGLLIGDPALQVDRSRYLTLDLAEEWIRYTGKPFVFAFWAVRQQALQEAALCGDSGPFGKLRASSRLSAARSDARVPVPDLAQIFQDSRDHGLAPSSLNQIAREWAPRLSLREDEVRSYLTECIHYELDPGCIEGLQLFYRYAAEVGALPAAPELCFLSAANAATV